jgi:hypothetical protein
MEALEAFLATAKVGGKEDPKNWAITASGRLYQTSNPEARNQPRTVLLMRPLVHS